MKKLIPLIATAAALFGHIAVAEEPPKAEVFAEWNSLPYQVEDDEIRKAWEESDLYGKALIQGMKLDSQGNMYVSTARWGGPSIPSTLSRLVPDGKGGYALQAYPSEEMNAIANKAGLKAVLGFEIDRNDVMWILDQGHVAGKMEEGDAKLVLWDIKADNEEIGAVCLSRPDRPIPSAPS